MNDLQNRPLQKTCQQWMVCLQVFHSNFHSNFRNRWLAQLITGPLAVDKQFCWIGLQDPREALRESTLSNVIYLVYPIQYPHFKGQLPDSYWLLQYSVTLLWLLEEKWYNHFHSDLSSVWYLKPSPLVLIIIFIYLFNNHLLWLHQSQQYSGNK